MQSLLCLSVVYAQVWLHKTKPELLSLAPEVHVALETASSVAILVAPFASEILEEYKCASNTYVINR